MRSIDRLALLSETARGVAHAPRASDILEVTAGSLLRHFDAVYVSAYFGAGESFTRWATWPEGVESSPPRSDLLERAASSRRAERDGDRVYFPLFSGSSGVGVLEIALEGAPPEDDGFALLLQALGAQVGSSIVSREAAHQASIAEARRSRVVRDAPDPIVALDRRGRITEWNPAAAKLLGLTSAEVMGQRATERLVPARWRARVERALREVLEGGAPRRAPVVLRDARGREIACDVALAPTRERDPGVVAYLRDTREARRGRREIQRARLATERAMRRHQRFVTQLGHELRNPLSAVKMTAESLGRSDHPDVVDALEGIGRHSDIIARLLDDLHDISSASHGKLRLQRAPMRAAELVTLAVEMTAEALDARGLSLDVKVGADLWVEVDPARGAQVFANLLTNAARYTDPPGHVRVEGARVDEEVVVRVTDTGIGLRPDQLERIFEPFEQVAGVERGGLGVGLALVSHLVTLHGGSVEARSDGPGCGSTFEVRLPAIEAPRRPRARGAAPRAILLVEDDADSAEMLAAALRRRGHDVRTAGGVAAALEALEHRGISAVVCDLELPDGSGLELARALRERWPDRALRLIALTGYGDADARRASLDAGFDDHLVKPIALDRLDALLA